MNAIDRLVTWASPEAGLRRMQARALADHVTRITQSYDAATAGRRTDGWARPSTSANGAMLSKVQKLADGARDLARNDPYIASAMRKIRDTAVGTGIEVQWADEAMQEAFDRWCEYSDADCVLNFYGQQALAARTIPESGSVLARFRPRRTEDGFEIPLQIQLLEPDFLDTSRDGAKPKGSGYIL
ncbi:MAG: phage portal protein, partial [Mycobacterium sp.]